MDLVHFVCVCLMELLKCSCGFCGFQVSAKSWDHNEFFAQFSGDHTLLTKGYSVLLHKLGEGLNIHTKCPVSSLLYLCYTNTFSGHFIRYT